MGWFRSPSNRSMSNEPANKGCGWLFLIVVAVIGLMSYLGITNLFGGSGQSPTPPQAPTAQAPQKPAPARTAPSSDEYVPETLACSRIVNGRRADATMVVTYASAGHPAKAIINPPGAFTYTPSSGSFRWAAHGLDPQNLHASIRVQGSLLARAYRLTVTQGGPKADIAGKITQFTLCGFTQH
jgi:hypothetical protein